MRVTYSQYLRVRLCFDATLSYIKVLSARRKIKLQARLSGSDLKVGSCNISGALRSSDNKHISPMSSPFTSISNPLATIAQLQSSGSQLDGISPDLERSIFFAGSALTQSAGVLLRLPQDLIAKAIVIFQRFWLGPEGGSLLDTGAEDISAASIYLVTKPSAHVRSPRSILNVYAYLSAVRHRSPENHKSIDALDPEMYYLSEGTYQSCRATLLKHESLILRHLGFQLHVALPYTLCLNYLQTLEVFLPPYASRGSALAKRAMAYLNTALLSPQLLYLTHQPPALAVAAIYLAARDEAVKLPEEEWWEVFDCEREELGFLCVGMLSLAGFVSEERRMWQERGRAVPLTVGEVVKEVRKRGDEVERNGG